MKLEADREAQSWWIGNRSSSGIYAGAFLVYHQWHDTGMIEPRYISGAAIGSMIRDIGVETLEGDPEIRYAFPYSMMVVVAQFKGAKGLTNGPALPLPYDHEDYDRWRVNMITFLDKVETEFPTRALVYLQDKDIWITKKIRGAEGGDYAYNFDKAGWEQVDDLS